MAIEWTNGWKVINFEINDNQYHGFIKVTKKGEITIECRKDVDCRPLDKVIVDSFQNLIVQKITITQRKAELICIQDEKDELKKSIQTKKKLKKALGDNNDDTQ
jgi:molybdopterin-guanine dinucleotide biosynthesis protein